MWHIVLETTSTGLPNLDVSIPWPLVLGPYGLLVYLVIENQWLRREIREMRKSADDLAKTAFDLIFKERGK